MSIVLWMVLELCLMGVSEICGRLEWGRWAVLSTYI